MRTSKKTCVAVFLGRIEYEHALELQMKICQAKKRGLPQDVLLTLEHPPTVTLGRNGKWQNLLVSKEELRRRNIRFHEVDRGGDITFHGPGQLVAYPIVQLEGEERDVRLYMRKLEEVVIRMLADLGIEAFRQEGLTGVWTCSGKIAAMGVHISRWITRHGIALNLDTELSFFDLIVPCGVVDKGVASVRAITQHPSALPDAARDFTRHFGAIMDRRIQWIDESELRENLASYAPEVAVA